MTTTQGIDPAEQNATSTASVWQAHWQSHWQAHWQALCGILLILSALAVRYVAPFPIDQLQQYVLPLVVTSSWLFLAALGIRVSAIVPSLVIVGWLFSLGHTHGWFSVISEKGYIGLDVLGLDVLELGAKRGGRQSTDAETDAFLSRYNQISLAWGFPRMRRADRGLGSSTNVGNMTASQELLRISYHEPWAKLALGREPTFAHEAAFSGDEISRGLQGVSVAGFLTPLVLVAEPEALSVASGAPDLLHHVMGLLAEGLEIERSLAAEPAGVRLGVAFASYSAAGRIHGPWASNSATALALFLSARSEIAEAFSQTRLGRALPGCALMRLERAAALVKGKFDPELFAAILNNAAVVRLSAVQHPRDFLQARNLLEQAESIRSKGGTVVRGALAAHLNLVRLDESQLELCDVQLCFRNTPRGKEQRPTNVRRLRRQ